MGDNQQAVQSMGDEQQSVQSSVISNSLLVYNARVMINNLYNSCVGVRVCGVCVCGCVWVWVCHNLTTYG